MNFTQVEHEHVQAAHVINAWKTKLQSFDHTKADALLSDLTDRNINEVWLMRRLSRDRWGQMMHAAGLSEGHLLSLEALLMGEDSFKTIPSASSEQKEGVPLSRVEVTEKKKGGRRTLVATMLPTRRLTLAQLKSYNLPEELYDYDLAGAEKQQAETTFVKLCVQEVRLASATPSFITYSYGRTACACSPPLACAVTCAHEHLSFDLAA